MAKIKLNKTYSSTSNDRSINRADQIRRDNDTIKTPTCNIYDVDYAVISYLREIVHPQITQDNKVIDMPILYTHNISNIGDDELVCVFWVNEIFDPENTDTYFEKV